MDYSNIYLVFQVRPGDEKLHRRLLGKFILVDGNFMLLEDHGLPFRADGTPAHVAQAIHRLADSQYFEVVNMGDVHQGLEPELLDTKDAPEGGDWLKDLREEARQEDLKGPERKDYEYFRIGQPGPQILSVDETGKVFLDGHPLTDPEVDRVQQTVKERKATLRASQQDIMAKTEQIMAKVEPELAGALGKLRSAVSAGHVDSSVLKIVNKQIFTDSMLRNVGNKRAYDDFLSRPRPGVHIHLDGNDFGSINKMHNFDAGNQAIVAMGKAIRAAMDESVGRKNGKLFRVGGDEFVAHVPTHEHAAAFARNLRSKLEAIPPVKGTHQLSVSMGFGPSKEHAEAALHDAKFAKTAAKYPLGKAKTHAASRVPGSEGPVPV
jgi:GGDEF domain-containing protein